MALTRFPSIRSKLFALFIVGGVFPIALVSLIAFFNSLKAVEEMVGNRTNGLAESVGEELSQKLGRRLNDRILAENRPAQDFLDALAGGDSEVAFRERQNLLVYLAGFFEEYGTYYNQVIYADAEGEPVFRFNRAEGTVSLPEIAAFTTEPAPAVEPPTPEEQRMVQETLREDLRDLREERARDARGQANVGEALAARLREFGRSFASADGRQILRVGEDTLEISLPEAENLPERLAELLEGTLAAVGDVSLEFDEPDVRPDPPAPGGQGAFYPTLIPTTGFTERDKRAASRGVDLAPGEVLVFTDRVLPGDPRILRILMPVFSVDDAGQRLGTMVANLRLDHLFRKDLMAERFGTKGELMVVNELDGEVLYHTQPELMGRNVRLADYRLVEAFESQDRSGETPWVKLTGEEGKRLASAFDLGSVPWRVMATAVPREFETEARRAGFINLLVASLAVLLAGAILLFSSGRISASIKEVTVGARQIADGNLNHSIQVRTHDEIQTLGETFNVMTASLRENISLREKAARELKALNETLEDRVQERTRELESLNQALNQAYQELKELDRLKTQFLSTVSHEFKTPLTSIKAFSEILLDEAEARNASAEMTRFLGIINSESDRLGRLIKNLLNMSRLESGRMVWRMSLFPVKEVVDAAVDGVLPLLKAKDVRIKRETHCPHARFYADRDRLHEVVTNLVENAIKFSEHGQTIAITCATEPSASNGVPFLKITIQDEGPGIPQDHLEKVFDRFSQVDASDTRAKGGTGLGLAICKEIVEHHGGRIWAESEVGQGAAFHFALPLVPEGEEPETMDVPRWADGSRIGEEERHV